MPQTFRLKKMNTEKLQIPIFFATAFFWLISTAHSAAIEIKPGNYILVRIPSTAEALKPTDVGVMAAKVFEKEGKLRIYFKNTEGPSDKAVDEDGKGQSITDGIFEVITGSSRGDVLFFRSIDVKKEDPKPGYLGSVYRGGVWGSTFRGVFIDPQFAT